MYVPVLALMSVALIILILNIPLRYSSSAAAEERGRANVTIHDTGEKI